MLLVVALLFFAAISNGLGEQNARTMAFVTIVMSNLALILSNRSWEHSIVGTLRKSNKAFRWILLLALVALALVIYVPPLANLFSFNPLSPLNFLICIGAALISITWFEAYKIVKKTVQKSRCH